MTKVSTYNNMFSNCRSLEYINIKYYKPSTTLERTYYFSDSPKNLVVCTEYQDLISLIEEHECNKVYCSDDWYENRNKLNSDDDECIENCSSLDINIFEYKSKCYSQCFSWTYVNNNKCEDCHPDCRECFGPYSPINSNCTSCISPDKFLYLGNCITACPKVTDGYYLNETLQQNICKCELIQCYSCSIESLK